MQQIYLHGLGQTPASWEPVLERMTGPQQPQCLDLVALLKGRQVSYQNLYSALAAACDAVPGPVELCGLSLGGVLALHYAACRPDKVRALVLIGAQYRMPRRLLRLQEFLFRWMPQALFAQTGFPKEDFLLLCRTMMPLDLSAALPRVSCPVLVLCGSRDRANRAASEQLAELLPNARLRVIRGAGHELNLQAPARLAKILSRFYAYANRRGSAGKRLLRTQPKEQN